MTSGCTADEALLRPVEARALFAAGVLLVIAGLLLHGAGLDPAWMLQVHAHSAPLPSVVVWSCATVLGLGWSALIVVLAADRGRGAAAALLVPTFLIGGLLTHVPKTLLHVPRPAATAFYPQLHVIGEAFRGPVSMPSGHALTASAAVVLVCLAVPRARWREGAVPAVLALVAVVVAWSRVVVGAHWPSDVLVGAGLGLLAVGIAHAIAVGSRTRHLHAQLVGRVRSQAGQRWVAVAEIASAAGLLAERTGYPDGRAMVLLLAGVAGVSAAWRWYTTLLPHAVPRAGSAPAEPT